MLQALDVAAQVAEGLAYAHDRHIVHRDIKPANVMVVRDGLVKITDFGIARMRTNEVKTMTGMIVGSPKYMSPEQVAGKRADHRCDLFSLGVVLYEMMTGQAPFQGDSIHGIMYQILNSTPPAPSQRNAELPEIVDLIVAKALARNAEERYQSAKDLVKDLLDCKQLVQSRPAGFAPATSQASGQPLPASTTRRQDKVRTIRTGRRARQRRRVRQARHDVVESLRFLRSHHAPGSPHRRGKRTAGHHVPAGRNAAPEDRSDRDHQSAQGWPAAEAVFFEPLCLDLVRRHLGVGGGGGVVCVGSERMREGRGGE